MTSLILFQHALMVASAAHCPLALPDPVEGTDVCVNNDSSTWEAWQLRYAQENEESRGREES